MRHLLRHPFRVAIRGTTFALSMLLEVVWFYLRNSSREKNGPDHLRRAAWGQRLVRRLLRAAAIRTTFHGAPPTTGVLVCNHPSYLDVLVLADAHPLIFMSKSEVVNWPLIGAAARCAGTLFINRRKRSDVLCLASAMADVVERSSAVLAFFPEGTSSGGADVLPFHSGLFAPAVAHGWPVTPAGIRYELADGSVPDDVAYWGGMTFVPHFLNLLTKRRIEAHVSFGRPLPAGLDRKALAHAAQAEALRLSRPR